MKLLIVLHTPKSPHSAVYIGYRRLAADLAARGHTVTMLAPEDFRVLRRLHGRWYALLYPFFVAAWLGRHARDCDLIVFHSYAGWVAHLLGTRRTPTITAFHGLEPLNYEAVGQELARTGRAYHLRFRFWHGGVLPFLLRSSTRRSARVLCLNTEERAYLITHRWSTPAAIEIVGRGLAAEFFIDRPPASRARRLLFVGQWIDRKGVRYLVQAFDELVARVPDLELCCLGTLVPEDEVRAAFPPRCRDRLTVQSKVDQAALIEWYRASDIFVFPSLADAFGRALIEAMATAMPIVTTRVGVAIDALRDGESCLMVPSADSGAIRDAVLRLIEDADLRARLGRDAQRAARPFESGRVSDRLWSIFAGVLGQPRAAPSSEPRPSARRAPSRVRLLIALHTPKSPHTAVYLGYRLLAEGLEAQGHSVTILAPQDFAALRRLHGRWYAVLYPFFLAAWLLRRGREFDVLVFHSYAGWVVNLLRGGHPRAITAFHGLEPIYYDEAGRELARAGQRYSLRYRVWHGGVMRWLLRLSSRRSDLVLCLNSEERAYLVAHRWHAPSGIVVVGRGITPEFFLADRPIAARARRLLFIGQWLAPKGIRYLAQAFDELVSRVPDLELCCLGTHASEAEVRAAFPPGCRDRVTVHPRVDQADLPDHYRRADLFVFPSLVEAFGRALLEAMATQTPIVTTRVGLAIDALRHDQSCLLVPKADAAALRDAVLQLLDDPARRARLGRTAQQAARPFAHDLVTAQLAEIFVTQA